MEPTLQCAKPGSGCTGSLNDRVLVAKILYRFRDPRRQEIAVFHAPAAARKACSEGGTYLKRVIGLPGDKVSERLGMFYVNGKKLNEPYVKALRRDTQTLTMRDIPPRNTYARIPKDYYLMMGDNRSSSCDSRRWGLVPRKNLIGKVFATYWPPGRISFH